MARIRRMPSAFQRLIEPQGFGAEALDLLRPDVVVLADVPELLEVGVALALGGLDREGGVAALPGAALDQVAPLDRFGQGEKGLRRRDGRLDARRVETVVAQDGEAVALEAGAQPRRERRRVGRLVAAGDRPPGPGRSATSFTGSPEVAARLKPAPLTAYGFRAVNSREDASGVTDKIRNRRRQRSGRRAAGRHDHHGRRLRPVRHPGEPDRGDPRQRRAGPDGDLQQLRRRWLRPGRAAGRRPDPQDDQLLRRREQAVRRALPVRKAGARIQSAGHPGRAHPGRRGRHSGLLHQDRRRHPGRRGQGDPRLRRRDLRHGARARGGPLHRQGLEGRCRGQSRLPKDRAELQSDDGDRGPGHRRRGRGDRAGGLPRQGRHPHPRHLCPAAGRRARTSKSASSRKPSAPASEKEVA